MALTVTKIGTNEDGTPHYHYQSDGHVVFTGPVTGPVTTADGTTYEVSPAVIEVASEEHAAEVSDLIGQRHATDGHPTDSAFTYEAPAPAKKGK